MKVAIYCRVSTDSQELAQQVLACTRFCEAKGLEVGEVFQEIGSGKTFKRAEFQRLISALRKNEYAGVVVFRFDRLGRNSREVVLLFDEFEARGISLWSINENLDTTTPIGRAMREIIMVLAQLERQNISEATRHRLQALKNLGAPLGRPPRKIDLEKARELRAQGLSWRKVAQSLHVPQATIRAQLKCAENAVVKPTGVSQ